MPDPIVITDPCTYCAETSGEHTPTCIVVRPPTPQLGDVLTGVANREQLPIERRAHALAQSLGTAEIANPNSLRTILIAMALDIDQIGRAVRDLQGKVARDPP